MIQIRILVGAAVILFLCHLAETNPTDQQPDTLFRNAALLVEVTHVWKYNNEDRKYK